MTEPSWGWRLPPRVLTFSALRPKSASRALEDTSPPGPSLGVGMQVGVRGGACCARGMHRQGCEAWGPPWAVACSGRASRVREAA